MTTPAPVRSGSLWRNGSFMKLWTAETISQFGSQVSLLAIPLVAIVILGATPFEVALLSTLEFLPFILLSLPAGAWVDRLRRRPILIAGDLGRAIALASIPVAHAFGVLSVPQLLIVGFVNGVMTVFFDVAYQSYLPSVVERDRILEGNSKLEVTRTLAQGAGPAIGGGLIGIMTAPVAIVADAISFLVSGVFVLLIRKPEAALDRHVDEHGRPRQGMRSEVREGLRYVLGNRYLRAIAATTGTSNLFTSIAFATYLVYVVRVLQLDPAQIGVVLGLGNVAAIGGALVAERLGRRAGVGPTIIGTAALGGAGAILAPLAPVSDPIPWLLASGAIVGFASVTYNITQVSFRQAITPARLQGRMNATMRFIVWGTMPIGSLVGGLLATTIGVHETLWVGSILGLFAFLPVLLSPVRDLRAMPEIQSIDVPVKAEAEVEAEPA